MPSFNFLRRPYNIYVYFQQPIFTFYRLLYLVHSVKQPLQLNVRSKYQLIFIISSLAKKIWRSVQLYSPPPRIARLTMSIVGMYTVIYPRRRPRHPNKCRLYNPRIPVLLLCDVTPMHWPHNHTNRYIFLPEHNNCNFWQIHETIPREYVLRL